MAAYEHRTLTFDEIQKSRTLEEIADRRFDSEVLHLLLELPLQYPILNRPEQYVLAAIVEDEGKVGIMYEKRVIA